MSLNTPQKTIKCPLCDSVLEDGYVMAPSQIIWTKMKGAFKRSFLPLGIYQKGERVIAPFTFWQLAHQEALGCENCGIIVTISAPTGKAGRP